MADDFDHDDDEEEPAGLGYPPPPSSPPHGLSARDALAELVAEQAPPEPPGPTDWRAIPPEEAPEAWEELRAWVEDLVRRYPSFDHHVVPACWFRHNSHVEALAALRDYERLAFFPSSPASSPYNFQIALGQVEARLRDWTARAGCLGEHREQGAGLRPPDPGEWAAFLATDAESREKAEQRS